MTGKSGTGAARRRPLLVAVVALGLWALAWVVYSRAPLPERGILVFRVDANEIVAYPRSDAAMDYLNGMALASGDGWVNWRVTNRWSVYRPGWGAFLGALILLTGGEPAAMQGIVTFLLAATAPAFMLLVLWLYRGWGDLALAALAAVLWLLHPFLGWSLQRTLMSEGPAMLLAVLFCALAVRFGARQAEWGWWQGLLLGLIGGALSTVREQGRYGVVVVVLLLLAVSVGRLRRRLPFFSSLLAGLLVVVGPLYLKTSIHLGMPYTGTPLVALYNVLEYTQVGREAGGTAMPAGERLSEREAIRLLGSRARKGMEIGLGRFPEMVRSGYLELSRYLHGVSGGVLRVRVPPPKRNLPMAGRIALLHSLAALGLLIGWRRAGPVALAPLAFAVAYILPMVPFFFYSNRFGLPVSWVGWVYVAAVPLILNPRRAFAGEWGVGPAAGAGDAARPHWPARRLLVVTGGWLVLATAILLWIDHRPPAAVDAERLFADERSRRALAQAGIGAEPGLVEEAGRLLDGDGESGRLLAGVAVLPMVIAPGDRPVLQPFSKERLAPGDEPYGLLYLVSPWKRGGTLRISRVRLPGVELAGVRPGDEVLVVRSADSAETVGKNRVVRLEAAAALPTRWSR